MQPQKGWLVAAAASALMQGVTWLVLALLGVLVYQCVILLPPHPDPAVMFANALGQYYVADESCAFSQYENVSHLVALTPPDGVFIINVIVICSSALWIIVSGVLVWEVVRTARQAQPVVLWCWVAVTAFICVCDLGTFINFSVDYANTVSRFRSLHLWLDGSPYMEQKCLEMLSFAAFMMALTARGYILWLVNVATAVWVGFVALGRRRDDQDERTSLSHHFLTTLYNSKPEKQTGVSAPWAVQSPVVGSAPRPPPWASNPAPALEIPRPFRLGPPPAGRRRSAPIPEPDYDRESPRGASPSPQPRAPPPLTPPHARDALRREPPPLDEMPRRSALKKVQTPQPRHFGKTVF